LPGLLEQAGVLERDAEAHAIVEQPDVASVTRVRGRVLERSCQSPHRRRSTGRTATSPSRPSPSRSGSLDLRSSTFSLTKSGSSRARDG
jgi:hypothetical protein